MATYQTVLLPPGGVARGVHLASVHRAGGAVWERPDGSHVESRETWPSPPEGPAPATLTATPADPESLGWRRITATPADPESLGWRRITPAA